MRLPRRLSVLIVPLMSIWATLDMPAQAQNARAVAGKAFPSVVLLVMEDRDGQPVSLGSGFFVRSGVVATNHHVVEKAAGGYARIIGKERKYDIAGQVGIDKQRDLVLLKLTGATASALPLGESSEAAVGDPIYVVGNPRGLEGTFSSGIISGIRKVDNDTLLQITAPISPGSSGGPVLNERGEVIGVAVASFIGGQNLNFAVPSSYLVALLSQERPVARLAVAPTRTQSVIDKVVKRGVESVTGELFRWRSFLPYFSFSIRNRLRVPIHNVKYLVVFYDVTGNPIDVYASTHTGLVPGGLAKRVSVTNIASSVKNLTKRVDIRILDFAFAE